MLGAEEKKKRGRGKVRTKEGGGRMRFDSN